MITNDWFHFGQHIISIWFGNIVSVLKYITDFPTSDNRFSSIGPIYYEYGSMVSIFDSRRISINNKLNIINNIMLTVFTLRIRLHGESDDQLWPKKKQHQHQQPHHSQHQHQRQHSSTSISLTLGDHFWLVQHGGECIRDAEEPNTRRQKATM